jgi:hypothetical protein
MDDFQTETDDLLAEENKDNSWNEKTANSMNSSLHHPRSHAPVNEHDVKEHQQGSIPSSPAKDTKYCINLWKGWRSISLCTIPELCDPTPRTISTGVSKGFASETVHIIHKFHHITSCWVCFVTLALLGILCTIDVKSTQFAELHMTVDAEMKGVQKTYKKRLSQSLSQRRTDFGRRENWKTTFLKHF